MFLRTKAHDRRLRRRGRRGRGQPGGGRAGSRLRLERPHERSGAIARHVPLITSRCGRGASASPPRRSPTGWANAPAAFPALRDVAFGEELQGRLVVLAPADLAEAPPARRTTTGACSRVATKRIAAPTDATVWDADVAFGQSYSMPGRDCSTSGGPGVAALAHPAHRLRRERVARAADSDTVSVRTLPDPVPRCLSCATDGVVRPRAIVTGRGYEVDRSGRELSLRGGGPAPRALEGRRGRDRGRHSRHRLLPAARQRSPRFAGTTEVRRRGTRITERHPPQLVILGEPAEIIRKESDHEAHHRESSSPAYVILAAPPAPLHARAHFHQRFRNSEGGAPSRLSSSADSQRTLLAPGLPASVSRSAAIPWRASRSAPASCIATAARA